MTKDLKNNSIHHSSRDDEVLSRFYKQGAKETAPTNLNKEIINYAANVKKPARGNRHFEGGWKVPLSLAASVVVVFGLLVQLDQESQQLVLPPIPELSAPIESVDETEMKESKLKDNPIQSEKTNSREQLILEPTLQNSQPVEAGTTKRRLNEEASTTSDTLASDFEKFESETHLSSEDIPNKPDTVQPYQNTNNGAPYQNKTHEMNQKRSVKENTVNQDVGSVQPPLATDAVEAKTDQQIPERMHKQGDEFAPIPVGDWLLMIEKLIARKDYAEAARQLQKFKQAHPKVNVEDLDAKLP